MTQITSHWFYTLDLHKHFTGNSWKYWHLLLFFQQVLRVEMPILCSIHVFVRGVFIWPLDMNKNQKTPSGETDDFLTWAILYDSIEAQAQTVYCMFSKWCVPTNDITVCCGTGCWSICDPHCGSPRETQWIQKLPSPEYFPRNVNSVHTFHMNTHIMGPTVVWPEGGVCCVSVRLGGISCGAAILSLGSSGGQPLKQLDLALADDSDIRRQSIFDARLWLIVRKRWGRFALGPFLKAWRSSPPPPGIA